MLHCTRCEISQWWWILWLLITWLWPLWRCERCDNGKVVRPSRRDTTPVVHYGTIASGNTLLKNARKRDHLASNLGALCIEMEAAGLDDYPCLVIRGICDYADSHKNDVWQEYAALTAAAFAKMLLGYVSPEAAREERLIQTALDQLNHNFQRQQEHNTRIDDHHKRHEIRYHDDKHQDCHRVFDISAYEEQKNINKHAVPGTCRWVLEHPRYREWLTSKANDVLWISADPGCGKSVLSRSLVDEWLIPTELHTATQASGRPHTICYFFFKDNEEQNSVSIALCAILHQLFSHQSELIRHALPMYGKHKEEKLTRNIDELWRILQSATTDTSMQPVICVLDALDECCDADRQRLVSLLCQFYQSSAQSSQSHNQSRSCLKWLVTSRPHDDIQGYFGQLPGHLPSIRLRGEDEDDQIREEINIVIDQRMKDLGRQLSLSDRQREEITQQLHEMDSRTYLWLHLVLEDIEVKIKKSPRPNQEKIVALPATVDQAYESILKRIEDVDEKRYAKTILTIIIGTPRPLSIDEMALAFDIATLSTMPNCQADLIIDASLLADKIRGWCGLFVFVKHNQLYLIHQTAKEFLLRHHDEITPQSDEWKHCLRSLDIDNEMAKIFVAFLCLSDFNAVASDVNRSQNGQRDSRSLGTVYDVEDDADDDGKSGSKTFFALASIHWADYVRRVEADLDGQVSLKVRTLYHSKSERFRRWTTIVRKMAFLWKSSESRMDEVYWASYNGHYVALRYLLDTNPDALNQVAETRESPLVEAAARGYLAVVRLLLNQPGIEVNKKDRYDRTALSEAAAGGYIEVVQLLLAQPGIKVNIKNWFDETALSGAAASGHTKVVQLLLAQPGIKVNIRDHYNETALSEAAAKGYTKVVQLLLAQPGIKVNIRNHYNVTALSGAAARGHTKVVQLLLAQPGIKVNMKDHCYRTALSMAATRGHTKVVQLLLAQPGIKVNMKDHCYRTALSMAATSGHIEVVQLLLAQPGIKVNTRAKSSDTALLETAADRHTEVV